MTKKIDLLGQTFNSWTVVGERPSRRGKVCTHSMWRCECICGIQRDVPGSNLTSGRSKSCGCFARRTFADSKRCPRCEETKPLSEFYSGRPVYCKLCNNALGAAAYLENPQRRLASKNHSGRLRQEVLAAYGAKCACCGEDRDVFLAIDHVHGGGNKELTKANSKSFYGRLRRLGFPQDDYQCLCHNCNWAKHVTRGNCPHKVTDIVAALSFGA